MEFGMFSSDFSNFLTADLKAQMKLSEAKAVENEKQKMSGKKSRRERRHARDLRLKNRVIGRLSYMQEVNTHDSTIDSESNSNSSDADDKSPTECSHSEAGEEIEFITSFGENSNDPVKPRDAKHKKRNIDSRLYKDKNKDHTTTSNKKHYQANCSRRSPSPRHRSSERNEKILTKKLRAPTAPAAVKSATPQEKLKIKMQRALKKQLKADRIAIAEKRSQAYNEQVERDEELREIAKKMRRKDDCDSPIQYRRR
uniref:Uncharacterized protein n=1 Tax=Ciona savignyi TaxID=51511 RepID=H2YGJ2_CIOSA